MKRKWLMIPLVTGILAAGIVGGTVLAHNDDGEQESPKDAVAAKVADILGIEDTQAVIDALTQATQEVRSDRLQHRLDDAVEAGRLTQDQADAYLDWYEARPEGLNLRHGGHRLFGFGGGGEGDDSSPSSRFSGQGFGGQRFGGGGEGDDSSPSSRFSGRGFGGQRFGGQGFSGQGQLSPGLGGNVPQGSGTSY